MDEYGYETGLVEKYKPTQLVVALPYMQLVMAQLRELKIYPDERESKSDDRLGLALLELGDIAGTVQELRNAESLQPEVARHAAQNQTEASDLDVLLLTLRSHMRGFGGWTPTMGKNRVLAGIEGLPYISGGSGPTPPEPVNSPDRAWWKPHEGAGSPPGEGVRVGVLDTSVSPHPRLIGRFLAPADALLGATTSGVHWSPAGHATFVAGMVLQRAPAAQLDVRHVLSDETAIATTWDAATHMVSYRGSGVEILNLSFGCFTDDGRSPLVLARAIELLTPEIVVVAAAGNHGDRERPTVANAVTPTSPSWPAAFDDVVAVGAADSAGVDPAPFSPKVPWVALTAPGVGVSSSYLEGEVRVRVVMTDGTVSERTVDFRAPFARWSGTSFAAAAVSGELAARAVPGRRSAHEALHQLLHAAGNGTSDITPFEFSA